MSTVVVLGANSFSGQDFVDLLLDSPEYNVIGVSRSPQRSSLFLRYLLRKDLSRYRYHALDFNQDMAKILDLLDAERPEFIRQSQLLANIWTGLGAEIDCTIADGQHHFDVIDALIDPLSSLTEAWLSKSPHQRVGLDPT